MPAWNFSRGLGFTWWVLLSSQSLYIYFWNDLLRFDIDISAPSPRSWRPVSAQLPSRARGIKLFCSFLICCILPCGHPHRRPWLRTSPFIRLVGDSQLIIKRVVFKYVFNRFLTNWVLDLFAWTQTLLYLQNVLFLVPLNVIVTLITWIIRKVAWRLVVKYEILIIIEWVLLTLGLPWMPFVYFLWNLFDLVFVILERFSVEWRALVGFELHYW